MLKQKDTIEVTWLKNSWALSEDALFICTYKHTHTHFVQSSKRTERDALMSMTNFLLDGAVNPRPAPLLLDSNLRECARSNSPMRPCCNCCCPSFPSAMFGLGACPAAGWKPFLKPPISRRNFFCCSELSNWAVLHWPKFWETQTRMLNWTRLHVLE